MAEFASNAKANTGVALGSVALGTTLLGGLGNLLGIHANASGEMDKPISRYEFTMGQELARKDSEIALLKSEQNTEIKIADVYEKIITRVNENQRAQAEVNAAQGIVNQATTDGMAVLNTQVAGINNILGQITQTKVPNSAVCPGWGAVNVTPANNNCGCNCSTSLY